MVAVSPDLSLNPPKTRDAPFFHRLSRRIEEYWELARFNRPVGTWLLLWPALWALWIAGEGHPNQKVLIVFVLGVIVMRAAGCVINDFADRDIDPHVRRTRDRPIAARRVSPVEALVLFAALLLIALFLVTFLDLLTIKLAFIGAALTVRIRSSNDSSRCRSCISGFRSVAGASRWHSRLKPANCRGLHGFCTSLQSSGRRSTTPSTR